MRKKTYFIRRRPVSVIRWRTASAKTRGRSDNTAEIFKAERVFRRHQLQHIQTVGADGLVDKNPFGTDGRRNAGADGFAAGIRVGRVDGERVAVAENGGVYVAELFQFGKVIFMPAGVYAPNFSFGIAAGDVFAVLKNNVRR